MSNLLELIKPKDEFDERRFYLHLLARCFLIRAFKWKSPYGYPWFLDGFRIFRDLRKGFKLEDHAEWHNFPPLPGENKRYPIVHRPDVFFNRIWESKPRALFYCIEDEDYASTLVSITSLLRIVENCTREEQEFILKQIQKYGN